MDEWTRWPGFNGRHLLSLELSSDIAVPPRWYELRTYIPGRDGVHRNRWVVSSWPPEPSQLEDLGFLVVKRVMDSLGFNADIMRPFTD